MKTTLDLPDSLIERLTTAGLHTDAAVAALLTNALDAASNPLISAHRTLFEQVHDAVFIVALDGHIIAVNHRGSEMTGYSDKELHSLTFRDLSSDPDSSTTTLKRLLDGHTIAPFERVFRTKSGDLFTAEVTAQLVRDASGAPQYVQSVVRDITERKRNENILRESERLLRQIIDLAPLEIFAKDASGRYIMANQASADAYGITVEEMIGQSDDTLVSNPEEAEEYARQDRQVLETGDLLIIPEAEFTDVQGRKRILRAAKKPLKFPGRDEMAVLGVATDITELKQAASELRQAYRQAYELESERQRVHILTQFIQDTSHEFRTPLSIISTSVYLMTRATDETKRAAHAAQAAAQIKRITRLLEQLQTMAELDSGIEFSLVPTNVNALVREVTNYVQIAEIKPQFTLDLHPDDEMPLVNVDVRQLGQAFEHILDNALRFTPDVGAVTVLTRRDETEVIIQVSDTGVGIPQDKLDHVMRRFWRLDGAHSTPGFGLGLPIAQKIVERHNGTLAITSEHNSGTTVTIILPIA